MTNAKELPILPHDEGAEKAVLASLVIDSSLINEAVETITPKHFYSEKHAAIFEAIMNLWKEKKPADLILLVECLKDKVPAAYLAEMTNSIPTAANFSHYLEILKDYHLRRLIIEESSKYIDQAVSENGSDLMASMVQDLSKMAQEHIKSDIITPKELAQIGGEDFTNRLDNEIGFTGISSGFPQLDRLCGGLGGGDLCIVGGQTGIGKSALMLSIAYRQSIRNNLGCAYFSLEMGTYEIYYRLVSKITGIESSIIKTPKLLKEPQRRKVLEATAAIHNSRFFLDVTPVLSISKLLAKAKKIKAKENIDFICIDYIQLISSKSKNQARHEILSEITKDLKQVARELNIPVIAGAQLNRSTIDEPDGPRLSHIGESFAIVQHADTVMLLSRKDSAARLDVQKARQARGGKFDLRFDYKTVSFTEADNVECEQ